MRPVLLALLAALSFAPAMAQQPTPAAPASPSAVAPARAHPARKTFAERFKAANTTNDGKLTPDQAKAAHMVRIVKNFDAIDTGKKGYVTMDDIKAFNKAQRAAHKAAKSTAKPE